MFDAFCSAPFAFLSYNEDSKTAEAVFREGFMNTKRTTFIYVTVIMTIPIIIFVCAVCAFMSNFIFSEKISSLNTTADNLSAYVSSTYAYQLSGMKTIVSNPDVIAYLEDSGSAEKRSRAASVFFNTYNTNNNVYESTLILPDGSVGLTSDTAQSSASFAEDTLFTQAREKKTVYTTLDYIESIPMLVIGYPVMKGTHLLGVYKRVTPLRYMNTYARNVNDIKENIYLLTDNGVSIYYEYNNGIEGGTLVRFEDDSDGGDRLSSLNPLLIDDQRVRKNDFITFDVNGEKNIGVYHTLNELNWICLVSQPKALLYYDLNLFQLAVIAVAAGLVFLIHFTSTKYLKRLLSPYAAYQADLGRYLAGESAHRCAVEEGSVSSAFGAQINELEDRLEKCRAYSATLERRLDSVLTSDPVTGLHNRRALYNVIDEFFADSPNQALIVFETGAFEDLQRTFGPNIANRMLEVVAQKLENFEDETIFIARITRDTFGIFVNYFQDELEITELVRRLNLILRALNRIDDLHVALSPHFGIVFMNRHLLGRSDWLQLAMSTMQKAHENNQAYEIFDFDEYDLYYYQDDSSFVQNVLSIGNEAQQSFTPSTRSGPENDA